MKIIISILIILLASCSSKGDNTVSPVQDSSKGESVTRPKGKKGRKKGPPKLVITKKMTPSTIIKYKNFNSILQPKKNVLISSQANGIIKKINFDMGKQVKKGDLLASIDTRFKKIDLDLKKILKNEAEQQLKYIKSLFEKDKLLFEKKILNKESYEASKNRVLTAGFAFKKAKLALRLSKTLYNDSFIYCPFDGLMISRLKQVGDILSIGMPIGRLIDNKNLELIIGVTWEDLNQIKLYSMNKPIIIVSPDNKKCNASIVGASETLDDITRLYPIKINLNECGFINGTQVKINIPIKEYKNAIEIKRDILSLENKDYYLFIYKNGKAIKTKINLLDDNRDKMVIRFRPPNPLKGELKSSLGAANIIINGQIGLKNKEKVIIIGDEKVIVVGDNESN